MNKGNEFTKEQWYDLYNNLNKNHIGLIKWLYDNHKEVLREYEKTKGKLRIEFVESAENENHSQKKKAVGRMTHSKETSDTRKGCGKRISGKDLGGTYIECECGDFDGKALCPECKQLAGKESIELEEGKWN